MTQQRSATKFVKLAIIGGIVDRSYTGDNAATQRDAMKSKLKKDLDK